MALFHVDFFSDTLGMCEMADVIIPQKHQGPYKTLYLLHGMSDDHTMWQRRTSIERYADEAGIAVVMPTTKLGWYTDTTYGLKYFTYVAKELPKIMRGFFKDMSARREDNFVAGLSMGGYGALKVGLTCPEAFCKAASLSGAAMIAQSIERGDTRHPMNDYWRGIFGDKPLGTENDLVYMAKKTAKKKNRPGIYMWCGEQDFLYQDNVEYHRIIEELGYDVVFEHSPGDHQWKYWDERIQDVIAWMVK